MVCGAQHSAPNSGWGSAWSSSRWVGLSVEQNHALFCMTDLSSPCCCAGTEALPATGARGLHQTPHGPPSVSQGSQQIHAIDL